VAIIYKKENKRKETKSIFFMNFLLLLKRWFYHYRYHVSFEKIQILFTIVVAANMWPKKRRQEGGWAEIFTIYYSTIGYSKIFNFAFDG